MAREKFNFWLDMAKDDELLVAETIDSLKRQRNFVSTVRDGIMIVNELRQGKVDTLLRLYPWIAGTIQKPTPPPPNTSDLEQQIADLKAIILEQRNAQAPPLRYRQMKPSDSAKPLPGAGRKLELPRFEDDDQDTLVLRRNTNTDGATNFFNSMLGLQQ